MAEPSPKERRGSESPVFAKANSILNAEEEEVEEEERASQIMEQAILGGDGASNGGVEATLIEEDQGEDNLPNSCTTNCLISCFLLGIVCAKKCDKHKVAGNQALPLPCLKTCGSLAFPSAAEFAFFPPSPPTYRAKVQNEKTGEVCARKTRRFPTPIRMVLTLRGASPQVFSLDFNYPELAGNPDHALLRELSQHGIGCKKLPMAKEQMTYCFYFRPREQDADAGTRQVVVRQQPQQSTASLNGGAAEEGGETSEDGKGAEPGEMEGLTETTALSNGSNGIREDHSDGVVIIFAHGNATDCGVMLPFYRLLADKLGVAVLAVEYSGYGMASGKASGPNINACLDAAYDEALARGHTAEEIILYGQSIGSAPACDVASRKTVRSDSCFVSFPCTRFVFTGITGPRTRVRSEVWSCTRPSPPVFELSWRMVPAPHPGPAAAWNPSTMSGRSGASRHPSSSFMAPRTTRCPSGTAKCSTRTRRAARHHTGWRALGIPTSSTWRTRRTSSDCAVSCGTSLHSLTNCENNDGSLLRKVQW